MFKSELIYLAGCDGTGKSTQINQLIKRLRSRRKRVIHVWLRFPFFISLPLLACARLRGWSWVEMHAGRRIGYWDFSDSTIMQTIFPWALFLDSLLAAIWNVYLPLLAGFTVVCDRFVLDTLVDLETGLGQVHIPAKAPQTWFPRLIPSKAKVAILDLAVDQIRSRRADLLFDQNLAARLELYRDLSVTFGYPLISSLPSIDDVHTEVYRRIHLDD